LGIPPQCNRFDQALAAKSNRGETAGDFGLMYWPCQQTQPLPLPISASAAPAAATTPAAMRAIWGQAPARQPATPTDRRRIAPRGERRRCRSSRDTCPGC